MNNINTNSVAINITDNNDGTLYNKNSVPILFIWDQKSDLEAALKNDVEFKNYVLSILSNSTPLKYFSLVISYYCYIDNTKYSKYTENNVDINKLWTVNDLETDKYSLSKLFIVIAINHILQQIQSSVIVSNTNDIYNGIREIRNKYGTVKLTDDSLMYAVRSYLQQLQKYTKNDECVLSSTYIDYIMDKFKQIIIDFNLTQQKNK